MLSAESFTTLWANSVDDKFMIIFLFSQILFSEEK